jgi:peptidyl-prolyl cis-trans isomerase D
MSIIGRFAANNDEQALPDLGRLYYTSLPKRSGQPWPGLSIALQRSTPSMLAIIRSFAKSWVAAVLIGLLVISFAVFGITDVFKSKITDAVITAGSRQVSSADFKRLFDNYRRQAEQSSGQPISVEDAVKAGLDARILNEVADNESMAELITRSGIKPSDAMVAKEIRKTTAFFDPISGKFDKQAYAQKLAENQLTETKFEGYLRDELSQGHYTAGIVAGLRVPRIYGALIAAYGLESRDLSYVSINPRMVAPLSAPTDAQLQAFMKANANQLMMPEMRALTVVRFSAKALAPGMSVNQADLDKLYAFKKDSLSTPEKRAFVQVPAKDAAMAAVIAARLTKGEDPSAVAKAFGYEAVVYPDTAKTAIPDPKMAEAAFSMRPGQVSGPVQGTLGLGVIKLLGVTDGRTVSLEEIRPQLEEQLRGDAAAQKIYDTVQKYEDAHTGGASLTEAAQKAGVMAVSLPPVSQKGGDRTGQPVPGVSEKLLRAAYGLPEGGESEVQDDGTGEYYAVKVDKIIAPALPSLNEIRVPLARAWLSQEMMKRLQAKADELIARVKKGETLEAVGASIGAPVGRLSNLSRSEAQNIQTVSPDVLGKAFAAKAGEVFTGPDIQFGVVVAKLNSITAGNLAQAAKIAEDQRPQVTMQVFDEIGRLGRKAARIAVKAQIDSNHGRKALGLAPLDTRKAVDDTASPAKPAPDKAK